MLSRRQLIAAVPAVLVTGPVQAAPPLTVYKTASCGCCTGWITTMRRAGYAPKVVVVEDISPIGARLGVPFELSSCHLTTVGGYVVVGHVPPTDVARLLKERPKALGITVPACPLVRQEWKCQTVAGKSTRRCCSCRAAGPEPSPGTAEVSSQWKDSDARHPRGHGPAGPWIAASPRADIPNGRDGGLSGTTDLHRVANASPRLSCSQLPQRGPRSTPSQRRISTNREA